MFLLKKLNGSSLSRKMKLTLLLGTHSLSLTTPSASPESPPGTKAPSHADGTVFPERCTLFYVAER